MNWWSSVTSAKASIRAWSTRIQSETPTSWPIRALMSSMLAMGIEPAVLSDGIRDTADSSPREEIDMADATATARAEIRQLHRAPEPEVLAPLLRDAALDADSRARVEKRALAMLGELRAAQSRAGSTSSSRNIGSTPRKASPCSPSPRRSCACPIPETADQPDRRQARRCRLARAQGQVAIRPWSTRRPGAWSSAGRWSARASRRARLKRLIARAGEPFVRQASARRCG